MKHKLYRFSNVRAEFSFTIIIYFFIIRLRLTTIHFFINSSFKINLCVLQLINLYLIKLNKRVLLKKKGTSRASWNAIIEINNFLVVLRVNFVELTRYCILSRWRMSHDIFAAVPTRRGPSRPRIDSPSIYSLIATWRGIPWVAY